MSDYQPAQMSPHSQDAEEAVLGSVLIDDRVFTDMIGFLKKDDFFILRNGWVYEAMTRLFERKEPIEYLTVINELKDQGRLNDVGGPAYITYLASNVATSRYADAYGRIVERAGLRRRMIKAAAEIAELARSEDNDAYAAWEKGRKNYDAILPTRFKTSGMQHIEESYSEYFDNITALYENRGVTTGVPTGFTALDDMTGGWQDTDLIILAARPGMGKTSLQINMMINAAKKKKRGAFFSLEMSTRQVMDRIMAAETGINSTKFRFGKLTEQEYKLFVDAGRNIPDWGLYIDDTPALTVNQIRAKSTHLKTLGMLDFIEVDYLQITAASNRSQPRHEQVREIAEDLKNLAKELRVPVIASAQLSRAVEQREDKRPTLSDLAESGNIERVADVVCFLYRDEYYNQATDRPNEADVMVVKHRNGPTGNVVLFFRKELTQFANLAKTKVNLEDAF